MASYMNGLKQTRECLNLFHFPVRLQSLTRRLDSWAIEQCKWLNHTRKQSFREWFQAAAAKQRRTAVFCVITQRVVVIPYRRFGTTYRSHLQWSKFPLSLDLLMLEDGIDRLCRNVGKELSLLATWWHRRAQISDQQSIYSALETFD